LRSLTTGDRRTTRLRAAALLSAGTAGPGRTLGGESIFEIGSITKVFTGVLLADMGRRGLEDPPQADRSSTRVRIAQRDGDAGETVSSAPSNQARPFTSRPCTNTKGSRSERSEESEDPPQADRSSTRARIAKRDGNAGETVSSARDAPEPGASFESRALAVEPAGVELASARQARPDLSCYRETTNGQRPDATVTLTVPLIAMPGTHRPTDPPRGSAPAAFPF
jgi:hypothetical protein